ncbi:Terpene synthase [Abortiporus biennis]
MCEQVLLNSMDPVNLKPFPADFVLQDLTAVTGSVFEFKVNPRTPQIRSKVERWFRSFGVYNPKKEQKFLSYRYDHYATVSFPEADLEHLETCIEFFLWAFSFDDVSDEGELQNKPEGVKIGVDISKGVLRNPEAPPPNHKYAAMLHGIFKRFRSTATQSACNRFAKAVESWMDSQVEQSRNRALSTIPFTQEFIELRRRTIGGEIVEAMVEYSIDCKIPSYVWEHPVLVGISKAAIDIMTWPNDLCSFNKEQADGDLQNLVVCVMLEHNTDLQSAIDIVTKMLAERVADYAKLKSEVPSFGEEVDRELARYLTALEYYVQGTVVWYYDSPRYFRTLDVSEKANLLVPVYPRATDVEVAPAILPAPKRLSDINIRIPFINPPLKLTL